MTVVPIALPPGFYANGTPYSAANRWNGGNLVRFHNRALRPIGGWERRQDNIGDPIDSLVLDAATETVRDGITYRDNTGRTLALFGHNKGLTHLDLAGVVRDISIPSFVGGANDVVDLIGYGIGPYGAGPYGTPRNPQDAKPAPVRRWNFSMWGENVLANYEGGKIYEITPAATLTELANAPTVVQDMLVTDQRIVMAIVNTPEIRTVVWSDRENNSVWASTQTNYAGSYKLEGSGLLLGLYKIQNQILILSETDAHVATYVGAPYVYGFRRVGEQCAPIHPAAVVKTDRFAMWLGYRNFWIYDGTLKPVECEIMDYINDTIDRQQISKMHGCTISAFGEIWWFYQSKDGADIDTYIIYDYVENHWAYGNLARSCSIDRGVYRSPIMVDLNGFIYNHEQDAIKVDGDAYGLSGPLELANGDRNLAVRYVFPDTQTKGDVEYEFFTRQMPTEPDVQHGPFPYNNPISTTGVLGREVRMKVKGLTNRWEVGPATRFDVQEAGGGFR